ncbi:DUF817 domain-containing protein [Salinibacterium sp. NK8237]|uniref:DUF817 domain-containing protein n=1 Tax=Salinibacterium sp. NK8237 TaxID=2792038 RepID=UPI0018CD7DE6|nr:DUF817 domain-containing protein [Salinibacterium sp. NK8237]MBH0131614.1 DUF817 domain-containing protein [Salinibacterium sp. NK8237]
MARFTPLEQRIDEWAHRRLDRVRDGGPQHPHGSGRVQPQRLRTWAIEFTVFVLKQAWACVFGGALLAVLVLTRLWYPESAALARNDFLVLAALAIQVLMVVFKLETLRELRVIILFHIVGTVMEIFKTDAGSWTYEGDGVLHIFGVPLYSGFMYAAVGSYMVRVFRLFELRFDRYPRRWITAILATLIYVNFFSHHFIVDARWFLFAAIAVVWWRTVMHVRVSRARFRMPILVSFVLVAIFIWIAENVATWSNAWVYPNQSEGWELVSIAKLGSWLLLMIVSVVLVTWVEKPQPPEAIAENATAQS